MGLWLLLSLWLLGHALLDRSLLRPWLRSLLGLRLLPLRLHLLLDRSLLWLLASLDRLLSLRLLLGLLGLGLLAALGGLL